MGMWERWGILGDEGVVLEQLDLDGVFKVIVQGPSSHG